MVEERAGLFVELDKRYFDLRFRNLPHKAKPVSADYSEIDIRIHAKGTPLLERRAEPYDSLYARIGLREQTSHLTRPALSSAASLLTFGDSSISFSAQSIRRLGNGELFAHN